MFEQKMNLSGIFWDAADKFTEYFEQHRLYFTKDVCSNIDGLNNKLSEACSSLVFFFQEAAYQSD
jgi:hypothetical protein